VPGFSTASFQFTNARRNKRRAHPYFCMQKPYLRTIHASLLFFFFIIITYIFIKSPDFYICVYRNFSYKNRVSLVQTILVWITLMHKLLLIYLIKCIYKIFNLLFGFFYIKKCVEKASTLFFYDEKKI
jgi:hypothetical protein